MKPVSPRYPLSLAAMAVALTFACATTETSTDGASEATPSGASEATPSGASDAKAVNPNVQAVLPPLPAGQARAGAAAFAIPQGFRASEPSEVVGGEAFTPKIGLLVPASLKIGDTLPPHEIPEGLVVVGEVMAPPVSTVSEGCEAMADEIEVMEVDADEVESISALSNPAGPTCILIGTTPKLAFAGFVVTAGRVVQVMVIGTLMTRDAMETLLRSIVVSDPRLVVGDQLMARMPDGFSLIDYEDAAEAGGLTVAKREGEAASGLYFAVPFTTPPDLKEAPAFRSKLGCDLFAKILSSSFGVPAEETNATTGVNAKECVVELRANDDKLGRMTAYIELVNGKNVMVNCTTKTDDDSALKGCFAFGETLALTRR